MSDMETKLYANTRLTSSLLWQHGFMSTQAFATHDYVPSSRVARK